VSRNFGFPIGEFDALALLDQRHVATLFALVDRNRDHLRQWLPWVDDTRTVEDIQGFIKRSLQQFADNNGFQLGIWCNGELVGVIGYHYWDWSHRNTEIGYWLGAEFQGRGLMTRACRALVDFAFEELDLNRVEIQASTENTQSRAIPERLGFTLEGIFRQEAWLHGRPTDQALYAMLRQDWHHEG
jgi:ribosomal-protein-serine acetyltransferase